MANYPSKFTYNPEWPALEDYLRSIVDHDHDAPGIKPGRDLDTLVALLTQRDRQLEDFLSLPTPPASGIQWEPVPVSMAAADWNIAGAKGVWDFSVPGQISQTQAAPDASGDDYIYANIDNWGLAWTLQADITLPAVSPAAVGECFGMFGAGFDLNDLASLASGGCIQFMQGVTQIAGEFYIGAQTSSVVASLGGDTILAPGSTHTIRGLHFNSNYLGWLDGFTDASIDAKFFGLMGFDSTTAGGLTHTSRFMLTAFNQYAGGNGGFPLTFANLKAWRIPIPELI